MQTEVDSRDEHSTDYFSTRQSYFSPQSENNLSRSVSSHCGCGHKREEEERRIKRKKIKENIVIVSLCVYIFEQRVHS